MKTIGIILITLVSFSLHMGCSDETPIPSTGDQELETQFTARFVAQPDGLEMKQESIAVLQQIQLTGFSYQSNIGDFIAEMYLCCDEKYKITDCQGHFICSSGDEFSFMVTEGELFTKNINMLLSVSPDNLWMKGKAVVKEGTGKFSDMRGFFTIQGYFNGSDQKPSYDFVCEGKLKSDR